MSTLHHPGRYPSRAKVHRGRKARALSIGARRPFNPPQLTLTVAERRALRVIVRGGKTLRGRLAHGARLLIAKGLVRHVGSVPNAVLPTPLGKQLVTSF